MIGFLAIAKQVCLATLAGIIAAYFVGPLTALGVAVLVLYALLLSTRAV